MRAKTCPSWSSSGEESSPTVPPQAGPRDRVQLQASGNAVFHTLPNDEGKWVRAEDRCRFRSLFFTFPGRLAVHRCSVSCSPASSPLLPAVCERYRAGNAQNASVLPKPCLQGIDAAQQSCTKSSLERLHIYVVSFTCRAIVSVQLNCAL